MTTTCNPVSGRHLPLGRDSESAGSAQGSSITSASTRYAGCWRHRLARRASRVGRGHDCPIPAGPEVRRTWLEGRQGRGLLGTSPDFCSSINSTHSPGCRASASGAVVHTISVASNDPVKARPQLGLPGPTSECKSPAGGRSGRCMPRSSLPRRSGAVTPYLPTTRLPQLGCGAGLILFQNPHWWSNEMAALDNLSSPAGSSDITRLPEDWL